MPYIMRLHIYYPIFFSIIDFRSLPSRSCFFFCSFIKALYQSRGSLHPGRRFRRRMRTPARPSKFCPTKPLPRLVMREDLLFPKSPMFFIHHIREIRGRVLPTRPYGLFMNAGICASIIRGVPKGFCPNRHPFFWNRSVLNRRQDPGNIPENRQSSKPKM